METVKNRTLCAVVIPIYKAPSEMELVSFRAACGVLGGDFYIYIVTHTAVDMRVYNEEAHRLGVNLKFVYFDKSYFKNIHGYNKLMLNTDFYKSFLDYQFILIYQLDAYVFENHLKKWCDAGYDYLGAPLFTSYENCTTDKDAVSGNGGLSLRKISTMLDWLGYYKKWSIKEIFATHRPKYQYLNRRKSVMYTIMQLASQRMNWLKNLLTYFVDEDRYFSYAFLGTPRQSPSLPSSQVCRKFAYNSNPAFWHQLNDGELPFGVHGWITQYDDFYKKYIDLNKFK